MTAAQALDRDLNERILAVSDSFGPVAELELICECSKCGFERLSIAREDYDAVRAVGGRYLVKQGHSVEGARVIQELAGCVVVEREPVA